MNIAAESRKIAATILGRDENADIRLEAMVDEHISFKSRIVRVNQEGKICLWMPDESMALHITSDHRCTSRVAREAVRQLKALLLSHQRIKWIKREELMPHKPVNYSSQEIT